MTLDPTLDWTLRLVLAGVLGSAALSKLHARAAFPGVVRNYRLLPERLVEPLAAALPFLELALALGLLVPMTAATAALATGALLLVFGGAMAINIRRGRRDIDCGCFMAALRQRLGWPLVMRNGALLSAALAVALLPTGARALLWLDAVTIVGATGALLLAYTSFSQMAGLVAPGRTA